MEEELQMSIEIAQEKMDKAVDHLIDELAKMRAGKANPSMLNGITVEYYGVNTPLSQVSNINTPDARTIAIQPWEKGMIEPIEKAILASKLGITPVNNGEIIRIVLPPLTEERRKELVKYVKSSGENTKVSIRTARKEANDELKNLQKDGAAEDIVKEAEDKVQEITNKFSKKVDELIESKENDILTL
ncbi:MAG: ribosome recycling factor [Bacteroidetes bacterium]|jgi:ribosome recycling factor|nr:ribosome recycling factor [Bacteroidota bacterium]